MSREKINLNKILKRNTYAIAIGDALGMPYQFKPRTFFKKHPVTKMEGHGYFNYVKGSWSDDTAMTLAGLETLKYTLNYPEIMIRFNQWYEFGDYTILHKAFDVGRTTKEALQNFQSGIPPLQSGIKTVNSNGNGALMRIQPLAFYLTKKFGYFKINNHILKIITNYTKLTHAHPRSILGSIIVVLLINRLIYKPNKKEISNSITETINYIKKNKNANYHKEIAFYTFLLKKDFSKLSEKEIKSSGYVVDTINCVVWSLLTTNNFKEAVIKAINLGNDADTIGSITAGIASILYSKEPFPKDWWENLKGKHKIKISLET